VAVKPDRASVADVISEFRETDACGERRVHVPILSPDGQGGYLIAIGQ